MRKGLFLALGVALAIGLVTLDAEGRGGRGGHAGGFGARPGNFGGAARQVGPQGIHNGAGQAGQNFPSSGGKLQSLAGGNAAGLKNGNLQNNFQNKTSQLKTNFTAANQPFTAAWYGSHPNAWQYTHPHADAWAVATFAGTAAWLGIAASTGTASDEASSIYTGETATADDETNDDATGANNAAAIAAGTSDYLPLGVFALAPQGQQDANALVQLAVNKQGEVRGNYYDVLTGQEQPITGTLDKNSKRATFKANGPGSVTFETTLANLTQPTGSITLKFSNGQARQWTLARFDETASQNNAPQPNAPQQN